MRVIVRRPMAKPAPAVRLFHHCSYVKRIFLIELANTFLMAQPGYGTWFA